MPMPMPVPVPSRVPMSRMPAVRMAGTEASDRHGRETGGSKKQQKIVQVHLSIRPLVARREGTSRVRAGPPCRYT
jgi:hypothetical protein